MKTHYRWFIALLFVVLAGAVYVSSVDPHDGGIQGVPTPPADDPPCAVPSPDPPPRPADEAGKAEVSRAPAPDVVVTGRVLLPDGGPGVGATVYVGFLGQAVPPVPWGPSHGVAWSGPPWPRFPSTCVADANGRFAFSAGPQDEYSELRSVLLRVTASLEGSVAVADPEKAEPGAVRMSDLRLAAGVKIRGRVVDVRGEPVPGVEALLHATREGGDLLRACRSDLHGRLEFLPVHRRENWYLVLGLEHTGYPPTRLRLDAESSLAGGPFVAVLPEGWAIRGTVTAPDRSPLAGVEAVAAVPQMSGLSWEVLHSRAVLTDAGGRFEIPGLPAGGILVLLFPALADPAGLGATQDAIPHISGEVRGWAGQVVDLGTHRILPPGTVRGRALLPDSNPARGARVHLETGLGGPFWSIASSSRETDSDGVFEFPDLPAGSYRVVRRINQGIRTVKETLADVDLLPGRTVELEVTVPCGR